MNAAISTGQSKEATIGGFVFDKSNGESLIACNIFLQGTILGSSTNLNGYFVIPNLAKPEPNR